MTLSTHDYLIAATLAGSRATSFDLGSREEYLAEYEAFLQLIATRNAKAPASESSDILGSAISAREQRHIPCSV